MNMFSLHHRVALATGGNGGIGLGMAEGLARRLGERRLHCATPVFQALLKLSRSGMAPAAA